MIKILGVKVNEFSAQEVRERIDIFLRSNRPRFVATLNPEIVLAAQKDEEYFYILNQTDLSLIDGVGLKFVARLLGKRIPRLTGADLSLEILQTASERGLRVLIINHCNGLSCDREIQVALKDKYPNLKLCVKSVQLDSMRMPNLGKEEKEFDIMFVATGAPHQEKFIYHNLHNVLGLRLAIGVGGSFDFVSGKATRAPKIMRQLGMEWLWRLVKYPKKRAGRIYNAVVKFSLAFLKSRLVNPWFYRDNIACLAYKKEADDYYVLIVEREDDNDHWQLPQGGTDDENLAVAAFRELSEETGNSNYKISATFPNLYKYKFGKKNKKHVSYKGQRQGLALAEFVGKDKDIKLNYWDHCDWQWVRSDKLLNSVHPLRRASTKIFLEKFNEYISKHKIK
ncbi:MAG: WecB/TagA/CpsF family glycosyltransferase [Candidatus Falkowbacteria bacterium]